MKFRDLWRLTFAATETRGRNFIKILKYGLKWFDTLTAAAARQVCIKTYIQKLSIFNFSIFNLCVPETGLTRRIKTLDPLGTFLLQKCHVIFKFFGPAEARFSGATITFRAQSHLNSFFFDSINIPFINRYPFLDFAASFLYFSKVFWDKIKLNAIFLPGFFLNFPDTMRKLNCIK